MATKTDFENVLQSLYPGEILTLIEVDASASRIGGRVYRFHSENISYSPEELLQAAQSGTLPDKNITFKGQTYGPRPFGITGINFNGDGKPSRPVLTVSNIDSQVSAMIRAYDGLRQARVNIYVIAADLLDANGSIADGAFRKLVFYIDRPSQCDKNTATFDLTSPYDMDGIMIPPRTAQVVCYWAQRGWYRSGKGCGYNGPRMFDKDNNPVSDPSQDYCAGTVRACKIRFGENNELDFGGCAAASLLRKNQ